jgi:hypothetical protein
MTDDDMMTVITPRTQRIRLKDLQIIACADEPDCWNTDGGRQESLDCPDIGLGREPSYKLKGGMNTVDATHYFCCRQT